MPSDHSTFEQAVEVLYRLNVGLIGTRAERHERPHKPLLLLAVLNLIAAGRATPDHIPWSQDLRQRFTRYFQLVQKNNDQDTPENPFYYLRNEGWWLPSKISAHGPQPLEAPPLVRDAADGHVFARIGSPITAWLLSATDRLRLREAIIARFFPKARAALSLLFEETGIQEIPPPLPENRNDDAEPKPGRSAGFRRTILEIYDFQCAACGLRIRLREMNDLTFVDAAHLIPFGDRELGGNDHPSNGIALCKIHHWAMDQRVIAPTPDGQWQVSSLLDARRSLGEAELRSLKDKPILMPHDEAFLPSKEALAWRLERLAA